MGFTNVIRRAASRVIPSATGSLRYYHHKSLSTSASITRTGAMSENLFSSSFSMKTQQQYSSIRREFDYTLVKVIDSEIHYGEESDDIDKDSESFPFKIQDEPGKQTLTLTRDDHGGSITVEVHMSDLITGEVDENENGDDSETCNQSQLPMVVKVTRNVGSWFEFDVSAYPDKIEIETMSIKAPKAGDEIAYAGQDFGKFDQNLQKAFHEYLDIRGINPRLIKFLHEYMINKEKKEYVGWLKKAKKFVEGYANNDDNKNNLGDHGDKKNSFVDNDDNKINVGHNDENKNNVGHNYDNQKSVGDNDDHKNNDNPNSIGDNLKAWRALKTELVYYYNTLTGESTYEKPVGFKVETEPVDNAVEGWMAQRTELGSLYFYNALTGESTYEKPVGFKVVTAGDNLEAWTAHMTASGSVYYYNALTEESTYDKPAGFKASTEPNIGGKVSKEL